ncbi:MAG: DUF484 family protein [Qingshengfaniella sp.]
MTSTVQGGVAAALRDAILSDPAALLEDPEILHALVTTEDDQRGGNVVDMRSLAMSQLKNRLGALEDAHQQVISAAYDNVAVTQQVHRAILALLEPLDFEDFLQTLDTEVADCLRLRAVRLVVETDDAAPDILLNRIDGVISLVPAGTIDGFAAEGRRMHRAPFILRQTAQGLPVIYGTAATQIQSEALARLDLGPDRTPALLVLGAGDPDHFAPGQATDLLDMFARVCERLLRGWLG